MCGIVGAVAERNIVPVLIEGLKRLEYRGYDSAGHRGARRRAAAAAAAHGRQGARAGAGAGGRCRSRAASASRTRAGRRTARRASATRIRTSRATASRSCTTASSRTTRELRDELQRAGYEFSSETDTEVDRAPRALPPGAGSATCSRPCAPRSRSCEGAYALAVVSADDPSASSSRAWAVRWCSASARARTSSPPTSRRCCRSRAASCSSKRATSPRFTRDGVRVIDRDGNAVERAGARTAQLSADAAEKGPYRHFMHKEIHEQPRAVADTLQERVANGRLLEPRSAPTRAAVFERVERGAHRGLRHQLSRRPGRRATDRAALPHARAASRSPANTATATRWSARDTLFVAISQSGETADTLAALRMARRSGIWRRWRSATSPESSLVRESELVLLTRAGPEIGVASTKAFTTQLAALALLTVALASAARLRSPSASATLVQRLIELPALHRAHARARAGRSAPGAALRRQAPRAVPRPRRACTRSPWRAR